MSITTTLETITPEIARSYLAKNFKNRRIRNEVVNMLARDILSGNFRTTHQGIAFYEDGTLMDGQHRLSAIIKANKAVDMLVSRGLPKETMTAVDKGTGRSTADVLAIGYGGNDETSTALRNTAIICAINQICKNSLHSKMRLSVSEIEAFFNRYHSECTALYKIIATKGGRRIASVSAACLAAMMCGVSAEAVDKFMKVFRKFDTSGCEGYSVQPALSLRRQIDDAALRKMRIDSKKLYLLTQNAIYHFVNNTNPSRTIAPISPRYDVLGMVMSVLGGEDSDGV